MLVHGRGLYGLHAADLPLDAGNSATTTRLMTGILATQPFSSEIGGDASLNRRPMKRILHPLGQMGADIISKNRNDCCPLLIHGKELHGITYESPIPSAQVKSCILLAGLYCEEATAIIEETLSLSQSHGAPAPESWRKDRMSPSVGWQNPYPASSGFFPFRFSNSHPR